MATPTRPAPPTPVGPPGPPGPPDREGRPRWPFVVAFLVVAGLVAFGAVVLANSSETEPRDDAEGSVQTAPTETSTEQTTPTTVDPEEALRAEVEAAYDAATLEAFFAAAAIPDPNHPALATTHTEPMLGVRRALMIALLGDGRIMRLPPDSQSRNEFESIEFPPEQSGAVAILMVCSVDDGEIVEAATGRVITGGAGTVHYRAAMRLEDGVWKLAERQELGRWPGVAGCAA